MGIHHAYLQFDSLRIMIQDFIDRDVIFPLGTSIAIPSGSGKECFYQMDRINLACPELGISVFEFLTKSKMYFPPED